MPLVKLPIRGTSRFALVDPESVPMITEGNVDGMCWVSVKGSYGCSDGVGTVEISLSAIDVANRLGKSVVESIGEQPVLTCERVGDDGSVAT